MITIDTLRSLYIPENVYNRKFNDRSIPLGGMPNTSYSLYELIGSYLTLNGYAPGGGGGASHDAVTLGGGSNSALALSGQALTFNLAAANSYVPTAPFTATTIQSALDQLALASHPAATLALTTNPALALTGQQFTLDLDVSGSYDNSVSGLTATSVQDAIDEVASRSAESGLHVDPTTGNDRLGGEYLEPAILDGMSTYGTQFKDQFTFSVNTATTAGSAYSLFNLSNNVSIPSMLRTTSTVDPTLYAQLRVDADGTLTSLENVSGTERSGVYVDNYKEAALRSNTTAGGINEFVVKDTGHFINTLPAVTTETEVVYIDATTGHLAKGVLSGLPTATAMYNSDALAAAGGIALNSPYWADSAHIEGVIHGTLKLRTV